MNKQELEQYFLDRNFPVYERENYDKFLKAKKFSFSIPSIHITGTNGKGSTANYIFNIYKASGRNVGLYVSPYFGDVTKMLKINDNYVSFDEYIEMFLEHKKDFEKWNLSSFEIQSFIAFNLFEKHNLDLAVIEVGMGGYIDATNIFNPILSIITSVSLEHTAYLGRSVSEIAANKAGIIKENVPVLLGKLDESAMYAIRERAKQLKSTITIVDDFHNEKYVNNSWSFDYRPYNNLSISTGAKYQLKNAALAIEATKILNEVLPVNENDVRNGLNSELLSARFEFVKPNLLVDGGHNPEAIDLLVESLNDAITKRIHIVFASFRDKNFDAMINKLSVVSDDITLTTFDHKRAREEMDYFLYLEDYKFEENHFDLIKNKLNEFPDDIILVTGSLYFAELVRDEFK